MQRLPVLINSLALTPTRRRRWTTFRSIGDLPLSACHLSGYTTGRKLTARGDRGSAGCRHRLPRRLPASTRDGPLAGNPRRVIVDADARRRGWPPVRRLPWAAPRQPAPDAAPNPNARPPRHRQRIAPSVNCFHTQAVVKQPG